MSDEYHLPLQFYLILFIALGLFAQSTEGICNHFLSCVFYDRTFCYFENWPFSSLSTWPSTDPKIFGGGAHVSNMQEISSQNNFIHFNLGLNTTKITCLLPFW